MYEYLIKMTFRNAGNVEGTMQCEITADSAAQALRASRDALRDIGLNPVTVQALSRRRRA